MIKNLIPIGNSLGLIIDRPILNLLNIDRDTELEITTDGKTLTIQPVGMETRKKSAAKSSAAKGKTTSPAADDEQSPTVKDAARSFLDEFRDALK